MLTLQTNLRVAEAVASKMNELRDRYETLINLNRYEFDVFPYSVKGNAKFMRISLLAGLAQADQRNKEFYDLTMTSNSIQPTLFTVHGLSDTLNTLIHLRYHHLNIDWEDNITKSKVISYEILKGADYLLSDSNLKEWLSYTKSQS